MWTNLDFGRHYLIKEQHKTVNQTPGIKIIDVQVDGSPKRERCNESTGKMTYN